ncbi:cupin domain-containing protein [Streptomyces sp. NPDC059819]|uniref:cupin domain-containing protein n=1 Tax=Streptomyces sp. NPDC059819 TaxID=3346963 RepID=UPI003651DCCE
MSAVNLAEMAAGLPEAWSSRRLGMVGAACVKVLRMDGQPVEEERHGATEALLVLDGRLELEVEGLSVSVQAGEVFLVAAEAAHAVRPGSWGTLVIVELSEE